MTREQLDHRAMIASQIAGLSLRIDLAKHTLLTYLREFDTHDGWAGTGFLSIAAWLAWRIDIGMVAARDYVRVAKALGELRLVDAAFAAGKLSYSKVRAITRAATLETEQDFIDRASGWAVPSSAHAKRGSSSRSEPAGSAGCERGSKTSGRA